MLATRRQITVAKAVAPLLLILCSPALFSFSDTNQALARLTACENNATHKVRFPKVGKSCKSDETVITLGGPSLDLEGTGALVPTSGTCGVEGTCPGSLTASLTTGQLFGQSSLSMNVLVNETANETTYLGSCYFTTGTATIGPSQEVIFEGNLCVVRQYMYVLKGILTSIPQLNCQSAPVTVLAGKLIVYGAANTTGPLPPPGSNPIPAGEGGAIISIIGSVAQIPSPCPSP
jgi:hypothetical protein